MVSVVVGVSVMLVVWMALGVLVWFGSLGPDSRSLFRQLNNRAATYAPDPTRPPSQPPGA